jgi:hypothetical protein
MNRIVLRVKKALRDEAHNLGEKKPSDAFMLDEAKCYKHYQDLEVIEQQLQQKKDVYEPRLQMLSKAVTSVSRQVTIRGQELQANARGATIGNPSQENNPRWGA